jgi:hypothetical protein
MFTNNEQIACKVKASITINHLLVYSVVGMEARKQKRKRKDIIYFTQRAFFSVPKQTSNNRSSLRRKK